MFLDEFIIVDFVPPGMVIWNIGRHMPDGYLPLVQTGGYDGCQVIGQKYAIKLKEAQEILAEVSRCRSEKQRREIMDRVKKIIREDK